MTAKMFNWVVVGASKGLGAALVQRILEKEDSVVFACARQPTSSQELLDLKAKYDSRLHLVAVDVTDESSAEDAAKTVAAAGSQRVDILINNAAVMESMRILTRDVDAKLMLNSLSANAVGAHTTTRAFLPLLQNGQHKTVINISSAAASTTTFSNMVHDEGSPRQNMAKVMAAYRASKAALNSVTVSWALDLGPSTGFMFIALHPGGIKTESGLKSYREMGVDVDNFGLELMTPKECAQRVLSVITSLKPSDSGKFLTYKGEPMPF